MFKVNNRNTRTRCEKCPKLTIKISERRYGWEVNENKTFLCIFFNDFK